MADLLDVLLAFVGTILVLALAAQSIQEIIKASLALKGSAREKALQGLLREAADAAKLDENDADQILAQLVSRLHGLSQRGVWRGMDLKKKTIRLDFLNAAHLQSLIRQLKDPKNVDGLKGDSDQQIAERLDALAARTGQWFELAMQPVEDKYRRRMRGWALLSSTIVVVTLNADAMAILKQARLDPAFRARVDSITTQIMQTSAAEQALGDSLKAATGDTTATGRKLAEELSIRRTAVGSQRDSLANAAAWDNRFLAVTGNRNFTDPDWIVGILISILLVSLGAPFWHDLLESLFGLKKRVQAQAEEASNKAKEAIP